MPTYGPAKQRDMIRSILPSKARRSARDNKRFVKQLHRARINASLSRYTGCTPDEAEDIYGAQRIDERDDYAREMRYVVRNRRDADKDKPITRWAVRSTAHMPIEDRLPYLKAMLPDNTIGRHAYQHLENTEGLYSHEDNEFFFGRFPPGYFSREAVLDRRALYEAYKEARVQIIKDALLDHVIVPGEHAKFNKWALYHGWEKVHGRREAEEYARYVVRNTQIRHGYYTWRKNEMVYIDRPASIPLLDRIGVPYVIDKDAYDGWRPVC